MLLFAFLIALVPILSSVSMSAIADSQQDQYLEGFDFYQQPDDGYGAVIGHIYYRDGWGVYPLALAYVQAGGQHDFSGMFGYYEIDDLPLDQVYQVSASKTGYITEYDTVELTEANPVAVVDLILDEDDDGGGSHQICQNPSNMGNSLDGDEGDGGGDR